jgi:kanamycin kinase
VVVSIPRENVELPPSLAEYAGATTAWVNEVGGITFDAGDRFIKWNPRSTGITLDDEIVRLEWAGRWHPVPRVLEVGADAAGEWMVTAAIAGTSAIRCEPAVAAREIGVGLRLLHDSVPVDECPWDWSAEARGGTDVPPIDLLVVCSGDACAPNTLLRDGAFVATVDLGELGVADRWADLAVASMSLGWNFGPGFEQHFFAGYGIEPDEVRLAYYRDLWNAG